MAGPSSFCRDDPHVIPEDSWEIDFKDLTFDPAKDKLGEGGYGSVYKAELKTHGFVAVKKL